MKKRQQAGETKSEAPAPSSTGTPEIRAKNAPRGRPFAAGQTPAASEASRFKKGASGNPGGRPKDAPEFREGCRGLAWKLLKVLDGRADAGALSNDEAIRALEVCADRGGFLKSGAQSQIETAQARLLVAAMALQTLSEEQKRGLIQGLAALYADSPPGEAGAPGPDR